MKQHSWKLGIVVIAILLSAACRAREEGAAPSASASPVATAQRPAASADESAKDSSIKSEELTSVFKQLGDLNGVELKLTVDESEQRSAIKALELDPLDAQLRQVTFFDTKDLALDRAGVIVRLRRVQGKSASSTIKLRPLKPSDLTPQLRSVPSLSIELDVMPDRYVCSASLEKEEIDDKLARAVVAQKQPLSALFSEQQRKFFKEHAPAGMDLDSLRVLGPITVFLLKFKPEGLDRKLVAELWSYPDGSRVLELSTKCEPGEAGEVAKTTMAFLNSRGVKPALVQTTKARTALEYFSKVQ